MHRLPRQRDASDEAAHSGSIRMRPLELDYFRRRPEMRPGAEHVVVAQPDERLLSPAEAGCVRDDLVEYRLEPHSRSGHRTQDSRDGVVPIAKLVNVPDACLARAVRPGARHWPPDAA